MSLNDVGASGGSVSVKEVKSSWQCRCFHVHKLMNSALQMFLGKLGPVSCLSVESNEKSQVESKMLILQIPH